MSKITKRKYVEQEVMEYVLPSENQQIVKVTAGRGNNLHEVVSAEKETFLVSMPSKFRKNIWIKRGDFIIIDPIEEGNKVKGEVTHILYTQEHLLYIQEAGLWPEAFGPLQAKSTKYIEDDLLPPSDSEDDEDLATTVVNANRHNQLYEQYIPSEDEDDEEEEEEEDGEEEEVKEEEDKEEEGEPKGEGEKFDDAEETSQS